MTEKDPLEKYKSIQQGIDNKREVLDKINESFTDLDTTFNFKVNSSLKSEFEQVCKKTHSNPSREIKLFMLRSVKSGRI